MLGIFNCNFIHMNKHIFKMLYKSLVQPIRLSLVWPIDFQYNRLHRGVVVNFYLKERSSCKSNLMHFRLKIMTSGGNNFNNFSENQLVTFRV